jgi:hypothetical protein
MVMMIGPIAYPFSSQRGWTVYEGDAREGREKSVLWKAGID